GLQGAGAMPDMGDFESIFQGFGLGDILGSMFGGGGRRRGPQAGNHLLYRMEIDLVEAFRGCNKSVDIPRDEHCPECHGSGAKKGSKPSRCRQCQGSGATNMRMGPIQMRTTCNACGGAGSVITDPCPQCRGRGKVKITNKLEIPIPAGIDTGQRITL